MSLHRIALALTACLPLAAGPAAADEPPRPPGKRPGPQARTDLYGDPLPDGAVARLGSFRLRRLPASIRGAHALAFSPDGKLLAVVGDAGVFLWDVVAQKPIRRIEFQAPGAAARFSPDGRTLTLVRGDGAVRSWVVRTGRLLSERQGMLPHRLGYHTVLAADGRTFAVIMPDDRVSLVDVASGRRTFRWDREAWEDDDSVWLFSAALSPDGRTVVVGGKDNLAFVFDAAKRKVARRLRGPAAAGRKPGAEKLQAEALGNFAFSPDGRRLASTAGDSLLLWDVATGARLRTIRGGRGRLAFSPDGKVIASAAAEAVRFYDAKGKETRRLAGTGGRVGGLLFSPDGKTLAATDGGGLYLWDLTTGKQLIFPPGHRGPVRHLALSADGRTAASAADVTPRLLVWDARTGRARQMLDDPDPDVTALALSPDGRTVAAGHLAGRVRLWDVGTGREVRRLGKSSGDAVHCLSFSPDGKRLAVGRQDRAWLWEVATGKELARFPARKGGERARSVSLSPDGKVLATTGTGGFTLWRADSGKQLRQVPIKGREVVLVAFAPDGKSVVAINREGQAFRCDAATGRVGKGLQIATAWAAAAALGPDRVIVAGGGDGGKDGPETDMTFRVWDGPTAEVFLKGTGHRGRVTALAFSGDGKTLVSGGADGTALVWDTTGLARERLDRLWSLLWGNEWSADMAVVSLAMTPEQSVPLLVPRVRAAAGAQERVARLAADLDSDQFQTREKATEALKKMGEAAAGPLLGVLEGKPPLEVRRRVERILKAVPGPVADSARDHLRAQLRAVGVLEQAGTPEARKVLEELSRGAPYSAFTAEAKAALRRLGRTTGKQTPPRGPKR